MTIARHLRLAAALLLLATPASAQTLLWSDEFGDGAAPDETTWSYDLGDGCSVGICGWGNNEFQVYTDDPANVRVDGGELIITALRQGPSGPFTSARVKTQGKLSIRYGTIEARIKLPDLADGLWPAFWTLGESITSVSWPACGEIDIFEMGSSGAIAGGVVNRRVGSTAHWDVNGDYAVYGLSYTAPSDLDGSFHVYRMEWTPWAISTYIDGAWIWTIDISNPAGFSGQEFHQPHFLLLNMAVGGNYTGIVDDPTGVTASFPAEYRVDWIRIYDNGYTELSGPAVPFTLSASRNGANVELSFDTQTGLSYEVLYKVSLSDPTWSLLEDVAGDGTTKTVTDAVGSPARYYRVEAM